MRIATDIGGTFTDLVYLDEQSGAIDTAKVPTTPQNFEQGVVNAINSATLDARETTFFVHGTTVVINALTERTGVKTGLLTTYGFRDVLEIGRANRPDIYNLAFVKPEPFVPRHLRLEVRGRMDFEGEELEPLNQTDIEQAIQQLLKSDVKAVAVCFLHSYANPSHELACEQVIRSFAPDLPVTLSHQITQEWREYERTNTAVLNSYVHPIAQSYLNRLENQLIDMKMPRRSLHVMRSNGGSASFHATTKTPINLIESGPVAGVIGSAVLGKIIGERNIIALDIGGTTAKTSLIENNTPKITTSYKIEHRRDYPGYPVLIPTVDIVEIGAGGGSIAWTDGANALHVGPKSAGADPGPACYGKGGIEPTVTDANLVAGRINPDFFLDGQIKLDLDKAKAALQPLADTFKIDVDQAAMGVIRLADANMMNALQLVSIQRGYDPRDFAMVVFGGSGALHGAALMRELQVNKVIVPNLPGVFAAWGMLMADLRRDSIRTKVIRTDKIPSQDIDAVFREMEQGVQQDILSEGIAQKDTVIQRNADMRYLGQEHTVKVSVPDGELTDDTIQEINERFHQVHEQTYTYRLDDPIELVNFHVTVFGLVTKPEIRKITDTGNSIEKAQKGIRRVNFDELGCHDTIVLNREFIPLNTILSGPLVIEETTTTSIVFPDQQLIRDDYGLLHIEMAQ